MLTAELLKNLSEEEIKQNSDEVAKAHMDTAKFGAGFVFVDRYKRLHYCSFSQVVKMAREGQEVARLRHIEGGKHIAEDQC